MTPSLLLPSAPPQASQARSSVAVAPISGHRSSRKELFPFQRKMIDEIYHHIRSNVRRVLVVAPGGSGKTLLSSTIMRDATVLARKPLRCFFLVDRNCLIDQTVAELQGLGIECAVLQGGRSKSKKAQAEIAERKVIVASLQTIASRCKKTPIRELLGDVGLFCLDECHTTSQHHATDLLLAEYNLGTIFLGLTGSPWLMSPKKWLGQKFDAVVTAPSNPELVKLGRVVPARCFSPSGILNVAELDIDRRTGDFSEWQMEAQLTTKISLDRVIREWQEKGEGRSTACYCATVKQAQAQAEAFNLAGIPAEYQSGDTPLGLNGFEEHQQGVLTRAAQNYRLDTGLTKVLCSVGTMTTGWNLNSLGCVMFARATKSKALFFQSAWRGSRACDRAYWCDGPKQNYILLDFGGNLERFGTSPNSVGVNPDDYDISEKRQRKAPPEGYTKICPECDAVISQFAKICPECKHEFNSDDGSNQDELDLGIELREWFDETAVFQVQYLRARKRVAYRQDISPDIAIDEFREKFGFIAPNDWHYGAILGGDTERQEEFQAYLDRHAKNPRYAEGWKKFHTQLEFGSETKVKPNFAKAVEKARSWWEVLGVPATCDRTSAKRAYLELMQEWHPDVCGHTAAQDKAKIINAAWDKAKSHFDKFTPCA